MLDTLTGLGDAAVLLPLSAILFLWLLAARPVAAAVAWGLALTACDGVLALLKLYFFACPPIDSLHSPSGHTGFSLMVYGGLATILALEIRPRGWRLAIGMLGGALVAAIAISRLLLGVHTVVEVLLGAAIGGVCLAAFARVYAHQHGSGEWLAPLGLMFLAGAALFSGAHIPFEAYLRGLGAALGIHDMACGGRA